MSLQFYSEIRGSLNKYKFNDIDKESLKKIFQLFTREKFFFEKTHEHTLGINHPSYTERSLFSTLNGYTSVELFMSRLSSLEKENILIVSDLITNGIRKKIRHHDFTTLVAIGSATHSDSYRSELQSAIDDIHYEVINSGQKEIVEDWNASYENIKKQQIQNTIDQKGNDIDLVLTGFQGGDIAVRYSDYYRSNIYEKIINRRESNTLHNIVEQFIYKEITEEIFLKLVEIDDQKGFFELYKQLHIESSGGAENRGDILHRTYKITLSEKGKQKIPSITNEDIINFLTIKKTIISQEEFVRNTYLHELIPLVLQENNISFAIEGQREDGSYYRIDHTHKTITKEKYLNPYNSKSGCLIIQFPDCRPIHLNVDISTIKNLYHNEQRYNKSFVILSHHYLEREEFLQKNRNTDIVVPETLSLEEQIQYIRRNKPKINWEKILEKRKQKEKNNEQYKGFPF